MWKEEKRETRNERVEGSRGSRALVNEGRKERFFLGGGWRIMVKRVESNDVRWASGARKAIAERISERKGGG